MENSSCSLFDSKGHRVASIEIQGIEQEWYYGRVVNDAIPDDLRRDLEWYDEVATNQMLSYLDDAVHNVEQHGLTVSFSEDTRHRVYSLHIGRAGETTFRMTPVPPPNSNRAEGATILSG